MAYERKDSYYKRAKAEGYRSRAAYKLLELNRRYRLLHSGDRVVDLGSWPGGWIQVAAECVGERGRVAGIDLVPLDPVPQPWVRLFCADLRDENVRRELVDAIGGRADLVLSDMAPKLTGIRARDESRALELAHLALDCARSLLKPGGKLLVKLFDGGDAQEVMVELRKAFASVRAIRPEATRKGSSELYALASEYRSAPV